MRDEILRLLSERFRPASLEVTDDSHLHAGHLPGEPSTGTHFTVTVVSDVFEGKTRLERHRLVYEALSGPLGATVHALRIVACSPSERR
jgi:BolA protein